MIHIPIISNAVRPDHWTMPAGRPPRSQNTTLIGIRYLRGSDCERDAKFKVARGSRKGPTPPGDQKRQYLQFFPIGFCIGKLRFFNQIFGVSGRRPLVTHSRMHLAVPTIHTEVPFDTQVSPKLDVVVVIVVVVVVVVVVVIEW